MTVEVIKSGLLTTLQDRGRIGCAHLGVGRAGAFDAPALRIANALVGNPDDACGLEMTLLGPTLRFHRNAWIAATGAPLSLSVNGHDAPMWAPVHVSAGTHVVLGAMLTGCRSYLAVRGGFDIEPVLGSRSTDLNAALGPFKGHALQTGDTLKIGEGVHGMRGRAVTSGRPSHPPPAWRLDPRPWFDGAPPHSLRLIQGSHFSSLSTRSRKLLFDATFTVQANSNRVGLRLAGPKLAWDTPVEMISEAGIAGLLQLPPSGQPIVFGVECPVSGGYPRIGQVAAVDLPRLAQLRPGDALHFTPSTLAQALSALREREQALLRLEANIAARLTA